MAKRIVNGIINILVAALLLLALSIVGAKFLGGGAYAIVSGSMEPEYPVGSLIYTKKVNPADLKKGDVITFTIAEDVVATHRIVDIRPDETQSDVLLFTTKGDANEQNDAGYVDSRNIVGSPILTVPFLGYGLDYVQNHGSAYLFIALVAFVLLVATLKSLFFGDGDQESDSEAA